jgi:NAD(P)-dependent dehydrogenase (short-subunit alcohol dehydrogenase family)
MPNSPLERLKIDDWNRMIDVNIKCVLYGIAAALPYMREQKTGHIINVSSVAGHNVRAGGSVGYQHHARNLNGLTPISGLLDCLKNLALWPDLQIFMISL